MTKRKRDIFTVIESINNWFESSEHCTNPSFDHGCSTSRSELNTESGTSSESSCPVVKSHPTVGNREHEDEVGYRSPNRSPSHVGLQVEYEVAREATNWAEDGPRLPTETEGGPGYGKEVSNEGDPGSSVLDTRLITPVVTEGADEVDVALTGIWRVFKDAGYDVW